MMTPETWRTWRVILIRTVIASPLLYFGFKFVWGAGGGMLLGFGHLLVGFGFLVGAAFIVAPGIARFFTKPFETIYYPLTRREKPGLPYTMVETRIRQNDFNGAMELLEGFADENPQNVEPYLEMMELALLQMRDPERAEEKFCEAVERFDRPADIERIQASYEFLKVCDKDRRNKEEKENRERQAPHNRNTANEDETEIQAEDLKR